MAECLTKATEGKERFVLSLDFGGSIPVCLATHPLEEYQGSGNVEGKTVRLIVKRKLRNRGRDQVEPFKAGPSNFLTQTSSHFLKFPKQPKMYSPFENQTYERLVEDISCSTHNRC